ncbi:transient receptor potential cation channel subfamily A member 1 homolog [Elysia marginata]|uniref:Transient receptor potential cation channel subfamily A member 1 homolog n=1 Tax=Elysia marginata TaxID=1093978 RepID=A0AAV4EZI1_9GAST|nr:transient receptor potential cation channel subfamily A member 1 homolog [Elysia marginata]
MATNPTNAGGELPPFAPALKLPEATETLNLTLHQCARDGDEYNMKILLQNLDAHARKKVNQYDEDDLTPLHYAARYNHLSVVKLLVQAGANFMRYGPAREDEAHNGGNPRWLVGYRGWSANRVL